METLTEIWTRLSKQGYESDKGFVHSYLPIYEKLLAPYRETALNVLEIGLFKGDSLRMWSEYFTNATIHGVDCSLTPHNGMADLRPLQNDILNSQPYEKLFKCHINIFDAEDVIEVTKRFYGIKFDVIIEDAGHEINQQFNLYKVWKNYLVEGGIYIVEDVQDIDNNEQKFKDLGGHILFDLRDVKNRYDDVLIVIK